MPVVVLKPLAESVGSFVRNELAPFATECLKLMLERGAITTLKDKHGNVPKVLAEKKGFKDLVALLEAAEKSQAKAAKAKEGKKA